MSRNATIGTVLATLFAARAWADPPTIHLAWDESPQPIEDYDYFIDDTDPDFPDVELVTGSLTWRIWSTDPDNPNEIGDIGVISSPYPENFGVRIMTPQGGQGARTVRGINLDPSDAANYSRLTGGRLDDLSGGLVLQQSSGGTGGDIAGEVLIFGDVDGEVTVGAIAGAFADAYLVIYGTVSDNITVADRLDLGHLAIWGNIPADVTIRVGELLNESSVALGYGVDGSEVAGDLVLEDGIAEDSSVVIPGKLMTTGTIDLDGNPVAGSLSLWQGGGGNIIDGGAVTGTVSLVATWLFSDLYRYSGTASFASLSGTIEFNSGGSLSGTVEVTGDVSGAILLESHPSLGGGELAGGGRILIGGDLSG